MTFLWGHQASYFGNFLLITMSKFTQENIETLEPRTQTPEMGKTKKHTRCGHQGVL